MDVNDKKKLAELLRAAAGRAIPEADFGRQFSELARVVGPPVAGMINDTATHYWGNFHERNIFFIPVRPDIYQVMQGQDELNLIAEGLEQNWSDAELKRRLNDI